MAYELHYWGGNEAFKFPDFTGRAEPAILLLEDANVPYEFVRHDITSAKKPFQLYLGDHPGFPAAACPVLVKGNFSLAQTPAIMEFLGRQHGYLPDGSEAQANCLQMALNAADMWAEGYKMRQEEDMGQEFLDSRLPMWVPIISSSIDKTPAPFLFGAQLSYADFELLNAFNVLEYCYGKQEMEKTYTPAIKDWMAAVRAVPSIAKYYKGVKEQVLYPLVAASGRKAKL